VPPGHHNLWDWDSLVVVVSSRLDIESHGHRARILLCVCVTGQLRVVCRGLVGEQLIGDVKVATGLGLVRESRGDGRLVGVGEVMLRRNHMSTNPLGRKATQSRCGLRPVSEDAGGAISDSSDNVFDSLRRKRRSLASA
jgi:hypothetical protein